MKYVIHKLRLNLKFSAKTWENFGMLTIAQVATILVGIVTSAIWARYLPQKTYGKYQLLISFYSMLGVFCLSGMGTSLQISAAKGFDR